MDSLKVDSEITQALADEGFMRRLADFPCMESLQDRIRNEIITRKSLQLKRLQEMVFTLEKEFGFQEINYLINAGGNQENSNP